MIKGDIGSSQIGATAGSVWPDVGGDLAPEAEALYAISAEILTVMELSTVLKLVVQRARALVGADMAYAGLADPVKNELRIVVTDGVRGDGFEGISLAYGEGVGGAVAAHHRPIIIRDYARDSRPKPPGIATIILNEGVVSVAALPMLAQGRLVGVLWVGFRRHSDFTERSIALLTAVANLGGIAIENDRLYDRERQSVRQLEKARDDLEKQRERLARTVLIQSEITRALLDDLGKQKLVEIIAEAVGSAIVVLDRYLVPIASAAPIDCPFELDAILPLVSKTLAEFGSPAMMRPSQQPARMAINLPEAVEPVQLITLPIIAGRDELGYLSILASLGGLSESGELAMWAGVTGLALDLTKDRVALEVEQRLRGDLIGDILTGQAIPDERMLGRAMKLGMDFSTPCWVALVSTESRKQDDGLTDETAQQRSVLHLIERLLRIHAPDAVALSKGDLVVLMIRSRRRETPSEERVKELLQAIIVATESAHPGVAVNIGISRECGGIHRFRQAHSEAALALRIVRDLDIHSRPVCFDDLGVYPLLLQSSQAQSLNEFARQQLGALIAYDEARQSSLVPTLAALFANDGNLRRTAESCGIHLSTLKYRLERIGEIGRHDLHDPDTRFNLQLALRILKVSAHLAATSGPPRAPASGEKFRP